MSNQRIMIVEDEEITAADIQMSLEKMGYSVCATASSGLEAIQKAESTRPDLILMDIMLKGSMDGIEAATQIKDLYQIPIVYLTAFGENAVLQRAKVAEPYGYITKPFEDRELHIAIEICIYKKQAEAKIKKMEYWLATVLRSIGDAVIASDQERRVTFMNAVAERLTGWSQQEALGKKLTEILNIKDQDLGDLERHLLEKVITEGLIINLLEDRLLIGKDGVEIAISDSAAPIKEDSGETPGSVLVFRDITASKQAEAILRASENKLQSIMNNIPDLIWLKDREGRYLVANEAFAQTCRLRSEDVAGKTDFDLWPQALAERYRQDDAEVMALGRRKQIEEPNTGKDGLPRWVETIKTPFFDASGAIIGTTGIARDISERRQAETENAKLQAQLNQAQKMEAIGVLAGGIAHDFNNILSAIMGFTEMARDDSEPGSQIVKDLDKVLTSAHRAKDLVKQILAFSRQTNVDRIPVKIQQMVKESLKMLRASIPTTIAIIENIDAQCGTVLADLTQIHQIVMNLCTNAYHAMEYTGGVLSIVVKTTCIASPLSFFETQIPLGEYVELTVSDTGSGIGPDIIDKIFDPYFTTKGIGKGTGMGLAITHGIIKGYGGAITVESALGKGSTFHVYFPVIKEEAKETAESAAAPTGKGRILFVDDEDVIVEMGNDMLQRLGYTVTAHHRSIEALAAFMDEPSQFDLVITDQTMPGLTGVELARRLLLVRPELPIILCTGFSSLINEESAKAIGIKGFALKPLTKSSLAQLVSSLLAGEGAT